MTKPMNYGFNEASAIKYNAKYAVRLGWYQAIPAKAIEAYPSLALDPVEGTQEEKALFAGAVLSFQMTSYPSEEDRDGKMGSGTWELLQESFPEVRVHKRVYIHHGKQLVASSEGKISRVITWKDRRGLNLHEDGGYHKSGNRKIKNVIVHWGGISPENCRKVLANKDLSSHFGVEEERIYQWLDTRLVAYHAGKSNRDSIGIDITQQPTVKWFKHFHDKRGFDVRKVENTTGRGDKEVITLHTVTAQAVRELLLDLTELYEIPLEVPRNDDGSYFHGTLDNYGRDFCGILGHHHVRPTKWDIACWWAQIFDPLFK